MALKTLVKVGEISNLSDARYCAGMGVEMLGFNLNPESENYISPEMFKEITDWVAGVKFVGEFESMKVDAIISAMQSYDLDLVEVDDFRAELIFKTEIPVIIRVTDISILDSLPAKASYYLIEDKHLDSQYVNGKPILVGGAISSRNLENILTVKAVSGIALKGSLEEKSGFKDYDALADILEALELED